LEWYQIVIGVVVGLICLMTLIILHELGHAITARRNGVKVEEFGLGMPPRAKILGKYKGTLITLNWLLPLGGFCQMKDDDDFAIVKKKDNSGSKAEETSRKDSFHAASYWSKTKILLSGIFINLITAMVIFSVMAATGLPRITEDQFYIPSDTKILTTPVTISAVGTDSPAEKAGLQKGDILISVAGLELNETNKLPDITKSNKGKSIEIIFERDGAEQTVEVKLRDSGTSGFLGASASQSEYMQSTWSAPIVGVVNTFQFAWLTLQGLGDLAVNFVGGIVGSMSLDDATREAAHNSLGAAGDSVSGPVGILGVLFPSVAAAGVGQVFFLMGIISLTLAIMNFLPIPGLDGGRWLLMTIFKILKKPLSIELEGKINGIGMMCLIGLIVIITVADVMKFW
jgi:regulator of sigma E protease